MSDKIVNDSVKKGETRTDIQPSMKRIPVHKQSTYDYSDLDLQRYAYRWVNASSTMGNNIERYLKAGYTQVLDSKGHPTKRNIGRHEEGHQYMMKIPIELAREDQAEKLLVPAQIEREMGKGQLLGSPNLDSRHAYVPASGIRITSSKGPQ